MIQKALQVTSDALDQYLKNHFDLDESKVVINKLVNNDGSIPEKNQNNVILTLINIDKETSKPFYNPNRKLANGNYSATFPSERFSLDLLFTSNFDDYNESLKFLDAILHFFQATPSINSNTNSNLPKGLPKIDYDIEKVSFFEMHNLWSSMGAQYQPSAIYKTRLVTIGSDNVHGFNIGISQVTNSTKAKA